MFRVIKSIYKTYAIKTGVENKKLLFVVRGIRILPVKR